ncbi:cell division protein [Bacillus sp. V3-13]|uniref:cell division protein FtsA n=1 Tax=Bacillus sp. V3-13 TaxID=2053728 RepID=UPI000C78EA99|nr:cell division protein FtsA [Bacillus sp. V3-13]PLR79149.1 cell division protein [Bacillus sp. V3-13]
MQEKKKLFALDIGTRSVVGIILEEAGGQFRVVDILSMEHSERAMLDGQIHDVLSVSKLISVIKEQLEQQHGPLHRVSVAAAGRALRTERAKVSVDINGKPMMTKQDILHLELTAVQQAQAMVAQKHEIEKSYYYYCVGYSVLYYRLDGEEIGNLIDQQGDEASVEIIATFLPKVVVESLISALHRAGLEMDALTLEPIAAINVLIPPSMRRLNVALVDIGAGTSDIAITDAGTVIAYGMVPVAGDEITEAISDHFLLDFPLAEKAKRELSSRETITITDILGFETEVTREDAVTHITPALDKLAASIGDEILTLNNRKPPKAVMLVGGGSLTPELPGKLAQRLGLPENRVAIRGIEAISSLTLADHILKGPELVTPVGIAIAARMSPVQYRTVYVNEQPVRLFEVKKLTVGDCLLAAGIKMNKLYGKPGLAMIVTLNGQSITIPGQLGNAPTILKNGASCSFDEEISNNDRITVKKGEDGKQTKMQIKDLIDQLPQKMVTINGKPEIISAVLTCNKAAASPEKFLEDRDKITCTIPETIEELLHALKLQHYLPELRPLLLNINGKDQYFPGFGGKIYRNGVEVKLKSGFNDLDALTIVKRKEPTVQELAEIKQINLYQKLPISFNGESVTLVKEIAEFYRGEQKLRVDDVLSDGDQVKISEKSFEPFIFQDIFTAVEVDMPAHANGSFELTRNDQPVAFHDQIEAGDSLRIFWPLASQN